MEEWKKIDGYDNYSVSSEGRVRNDKTLRILKVGYNKDGYLNVKLWKNGKEKNFLVHRLVAIMFLPNPENKPCVDHINCVRDDNRVENLRWSSQKDNCNNPLTRKRSSEARKGKRTGKNNPMYGRTGENHPNSKKVICVTTGKIYGSINEAERQTGVKQGDIIRCCRGKRKTAGKDEYGNKLIWMYLDEYLESLK